LIDEEVLKKLNEKIGQLRDLAEEILEAGEGIPAVERNTARILAGVAMLELNVSDVREFLS
jgi:hypothetical protein